MLFPWLQVQYDAKRGTSAPVLCEHTSFYHAFGKTRQFVLKISGSLEQDLIVPSPSLQQDAHGVWLRRFDDLTAIAEFCVPLISQPQAPHLGQSRAHVLDQLCGEVLAPLSSLIVLSVDSLGGLEPAAKLLARWMRFSPLTDVLPRPCLFVFTQKLVRNEKEFERLLTTELLDLLRGLHPEQPYCWKEVRKMWTSHVDRVQFVHEDHWTRINTHLKAASHTRLSQGLGFSSLNFKKLLQKAIIASWEREEGFDILKTLGIRDPLSRDAGRYLDQFLTSHHGLNRLDIVASCLAYSIYSQASHGL